MRLMPCAAALGLTLAACCAPAAPGPIRAPAAARFNLDTPLEVLADNRKPRAVLTKDFPGLFQHPSFDLFKGMSLRQVQPYSQGVLTDQMMAKVEADLAAIK